MPEHGSVAKYRNYGCRCDKCRAANAKYSRELRARNAKVRMQNGHKYASVVPIAKDAQPQANPAGPGPNEQAVIAQCANMPKAAEKPSIVEQAKTLARILDDPSLMPAHPQTSRQLQSLLVSLDGPRKKSRGRLASVQAMTNIERRQAK